MAVESPPFLTSRSFRHPSLNAVGKGSTGEEQGNTMAVTKDNERIDFGLIRSGRNQQHR